MIVPPCRPLLTLPSLRLAAVSFLFVFSVDHPLCPSLPGFHQSERDDSESDSALYVVGMRGESSLSVCRGRVSSQTWFKAEGSKLLLEIFWVHANTCVTGLCMWGALENEGTSDTGCEYVTHAGDGERAAAGPHSQLPFLPILEAETHWHWQNDSLVF